MEKKVKEILKEMVSNWEDLSSKEQIGLVVMVMGVVMSFTYAGATGMWFFNPFNPATWAGKFLRARLFYLLCGMVSTSGVVIAMQDK